MRLLDIFRGGASAPVAAPASTARLRAEGEYGTFESLKDPRLLEFMRDGLMAASGLSVNVETALRNPAMFRACSLIANSMGMLPLNLIDKKTKKKLLGHPVYKILHRRPNGFQSAFDFRATMQLRALVHGDGYALIVTSRDVLARRDKPIALVPLDSRRMDVKLNDDWSVRYEYTTKNGGKRVYSSREILHLRGMSLDGLKGFSMVAQAREAIGLALSAELAAGRIFKNGAFIDGVLVSKGELSDAAFNRLKESWAERYNGADNAGKTPILEGETDYKLVGSSAKDAQMTELRKLQVEEIARVTGVPRPLLMVDETAWGTGIFALGQFFVAYGLNPWCTAWQQGIERSMLTEEEADLYEVKFNPGALLQGSLKDQADYFAKALGSGGHQPWMHYDEVRETMDLPQREIAPNPIAGASQQPKEDDDPEPDPKPKPAEEDIENDDD
jgi:HK97 family phage portal protein